MNHFPPALTVPCHCRAVWQRYSSQVSNIIAPTLAYSTTSLETRCTDIESPACVA